MPSRAAACLLAAALLFAPAASRAQAFATVDAAVGAAGTIAADGSSTPLAAGQKVEQGQVLATQADGELHLVTDDGAFIALRPNSRLRIERYQTAAAAGDQIALNLLRGALRSITGWIAKRNPAAYRVTTPSATIGIRGTDHEISLLEAATDRDRAGTYLSVREGEAVIRGAQGELVVRPGQHGFAVRDAAVAPELLDRPPAFLAARKLRMEERIETRKEFLQRRMQQFMEERQRSGDLAEKLQSATPEQRETILKNLRRKAQQRRAN
jgi:hypothetical protein